MKSVTLDIETIQPRWKPPEDTPDQFPPLPYHEPVVISWLCVDSSEPNPFRFRTTRLDLDAERGVLIELAGDITGADILITFNGRGFDMPVLGMRATLCAVDWAFWHDWRHRYGNYKQALRHIDLLDQFTDYGAGRFFKLGALCELLGLPGKLADGGDVSAMWADGDDGRQKVADYCDHDVYLTWLAYLRWCWTFQGKDTKQIWKASKEWWHARQEGI